MARETGSIISRRTLRTFELFATEAAVKKTFLAGHRGLGSAVTECL
jgi:hypothetical protein